MTILIDIKYSPSYKQSFKFSNNEVFNLQEIQNKLKENNSSTPKQEDISTRFENMKNNILFVDTMHRKFFDGLDGMYTTHTDRQLHAYYSTKINPYLSKEYGQAGKYVFDRSMANMEGNRHLIFHNELESRDALDKNITQSSYEESIAYMKTLVDKFLHDEFKKDPHSQRTNALLFIKADLETLYSRWEMNKQEVGKILIETMQQENVKQHELEKALVSIDSIRTRQVLDMFTVSTSIAGMLDGYLSDTERIKLYDAIHTAYNYIRSNASNTELETMELALKHELKSLQNAHVSRVGVDNTSILLGLSADSHPSSIHNETKQSIESLFTQIKKARHSDSILREAMALKENHS